MVEIGTTHNVGSSLRVWLVTLPDQRLTRPCLAECVLAIATGLAVDRVDLSVHAQCVVASSPILSSYCLLRPWYVCLSAVAYGDSLTTSQDEVPLEGIHAFYWEMGPFKTRIRKKINCFVFQILWTRRMKTMISWVPQLLMSGLSLWILLNVCTYRQ